MELSYCWLPRRPSNYAELIRISLPGWNISHCDYTNPLRTRVGSAHLADWGCVQPLITESAPLSKLHQGRKISDDCQHLVFSVPPKFPMWETASAPTLIQCPSLWRTEHPWRGPRDSSLPMKYECVWMEALRPSPLLPFPHLRWWKQEAPGSQGLWEIKMSRAGSTMSSTAEMFQVVSTALSNLSCLIPHQSQVETFFNLIFNLY